MASQYEALFEAPASHEAANGYSNPEFENEWEANPYSNSEFENEWEANHEHEFEANPYSNSEFENEWEANHEHEFEANPYSNPEFESEWEANPYSNPELQEGEFFFKKLKKGMKFLAPLAKKLAPIAAKSLAGMIPGGSAVAGPLTSKLTSALVQEAEMEVAQMEANLFGTNESEAEVANYEVAHEAALTEFLAAQAAEASTEAEAEAAIGATLPITVAIMGGKQALRPVMPALTQATSQLTKVLSQQGPAGKQLLRTVPTIERRTVATLKAAARSGQPITSATAVRAMATATNQVLSNPQTVQKAVVRNAVLRQRTAPPHPRRATQTSRCSKCAAAGR